MRHTKGGAEPTNGLKNEKVGPTNGAEVVDRMGWQMGQGVEWGRQQIGRGNKWAGATNGQRQLMCRGNKWTEAMNGQRQ
jgi:hypothetical protein